MRRVAPNSFAIPFSVAGLGGTWLAAADAGWAPRPVGEALFLVAAVLWLAVLVAYGAQVAADPGTLRSDLVHPVSSPFLSLVTATPMVLVARGLTPFAPAAATVLTDVLIGLIHSSGALAVGSPSSVIWKLIPSIRVLRASAAARHEV
jgi:tellurite resistance protein